VPLKNCANPITKIDTHTVRGRDVFVVVVSSLNVIGIDVTVEKTTDSGGHWKNVHFYTIL